MATTLAWNPIELLVSWNFNKWMSCELGLSIFMLEFQKISCRNDTYINWIILENMGIFTIARLADTVRSNFWGADVALISKCDSIYRIDIRCVHLAQLLLLSQISTQVCVAHSNTILGWFYKHKLVLQGSSQDTEFFFNTSVLETNI